MKRGNELVISGFDFKRYGGCFEQTPCYLGLAKSVIALQIFYSKTKNNSVEKKLESGISYMLEHSFYRRLNQNILITSHITYISFPETYHLNVIELIRFAKNAGLLHYEKTKDLIHLIINKQLKTRNWKNNFTYKAKGYLTFDTGKHHSEWTTYIIKQAIDTE